VETTGSTLAVGDLARLLSRRAPDAYEHFDAREEGWTKMVVKPQAAAGAGKHRVTEERGRKRAPRREHEHAHRGSVEHRVSVTGPPCSHISHRVGLRRGRRR
jgi:hypothetical protein